MNVEESCKVLCTMRYSKADMEEFKLKIEEDYRVNWIVDNLPAATRVVEPPSAGTCPTPLPRTPLSLPLPSFPLPSLPLSSPSPFPLPPHIPA